jgi:DNA-binding MarR family transcriptional regulator
MSITSGKIAAQPEPMHEAALERGFEALSTLAILLKIDGERVTAHTRLSQPMLTALARLARLPDQTTVSALARSLSCNMGNLSGTLDRLEEAGYVERVVCESDRRARFIQLTNKGRRMATQLTERFRNERVCSALKQMSVHELEGLTETINGLISAAKAG